MEEYQLIVQDGILLVSLGLCRAATEALVYCIGPIKAANWLDKNI
jgi:hypothetical protein